ncbi:AraC family transcriptional regulator [Streptomyces bacillaris]|uniref:AraC family transcriptional regulator n=1 Tax=Streptomyces bacillaris TaxID=68179 RepID=UPI00345F4D65
MVIGRTALVQVPAAAGLDPLLLLVAALCSGHRDVLPLPRPTGRSAATVAGELMRNPGDPRTASEWAESLYTSSTSLRRAFRAETGLAFSEWRTRLRLDHSL